MVTSVANGKTKPEKSKAPEGLVSLLTLIPNAYYDLIARVAPGLVLIVAITMYQWHSEIFTKDGLSNLATTPVLVVALLLSYMIGMILTGIAFIWDFISFIILLELWNSSMTPKWWCLCSRFMQKWAAYSSDMDGVGKANEAAGATLAKMMAETSLCENLLSGLLVLGGVGTMSDGTAFYRPEKYIKEYATLAALLLVAVLYRQKLYVGRVKSMRATYPNEREA